MKVDEKKLTKKIGEIISSGVLSSESVDATSQKVIVEIQPLITAINHLSSQQQKVAHDAFKEGFNSAFRMLEEAKNNL